MLLKTDILLNELYPGDMPTLFMQLLYSELLFEYSSIDLTVLGFKCLKMTLRWSQP
jgi:hypothetical protein